MAPTPGIYRLCLIIPAISLGLTLYPVTFIAAQECTAPAPNPHTDYEQNQLVVCPGDDITGVQVVNDTYVEVAEDAQITNENGVNAVTMNDDNRLENYGTVTSDDGHAVVVHDNNVIANRDLNFTNGQDDSMISSENHDAVNGGYNTWIANSGTISGGDNAIHTANTLTVNNNDGGVITATNDAINTSHNAQIQNSGTIISETADAIEVTDNAWIDNGTYQPGTIEGASSAIEAGNEAWIRNGQDSIISAGCDAITAGDNLQLENNAALSTLPWEAPQPGDRADISSENCTAVVAGDNAQITNAGSIYTEDAYQDSATLGGVNAIRVGDHATIENSNHLGYGEIIGDCHAIRAGDDLNVSNTGEIRGVNCDGISADANLTVNAQAGSIIGENGDGIDMDYGTVFIHPDALVQGGDDGIEIDGSTSGATLIWNAGTISGNVGVNAHLNSNTDSQHVINGGTIEGTGGIAVDLGRGDDELEALAGSLFIGTIDGGADHDVFTFSYYFEAESFYVPEEYQRIEQTISAAPTENCPCVLELNVGGTLYSYVYVNFEQLQSLLHFIQTQVTPYQHLSGCYNGVRCYALESGGSKTGIVQIYNAEGADGMEIASFDVWSLAYGDQTFSGAGGWTVYIGERQDNGDTSRYSLSVYDPAGNLRVAGIGLLLFHENHGFAWE